MRRVLMADRGEIAVRVIRARHHARLASAAACARPGLAEPRVQMVDGVATAGRITIVDVPSGLLKG